MITGDGPAIFRCLQDIAVEVRKAVRSSACLLWAPSTLSPPVVRQGPAKYDSQTPKLSMKLAEIIDVFIATDAGEGRTLKGVPAERVAARARRSRRSDRVHAEARCTISVARQRALSHRGTRRAVRHVPRRPGQGHVWRDRRRLLSSCQSTGDELRKTIAAGKKLRITSPSGTDLKVGIAGRPVLVSDGIISPEEMKKGGAAMNVWLPAGEVYVTPVAGTAEGVIVADHIFYEGKRIDGLKLEIKGGRMRISMNAKSGLESLRAYYDASGAGKDLVGRRGYRDQSGHQGR